MSSKSFYYCSIKPVKGSGIYKNPGRSYFLNLDTPALQSPSPDGHTVHGVLTDEDLQTLRQRGFGVRVISGPHASAFEAENNLDDFWEVHDDDW